MNGDSSLEQWMRSICQTESKNDPVTSPFRVSCVSVFRQAHPTALYCDKSERIVLVTKEDAKALCFVFPHFYLPEMFFELIIVWIYFV